ncbi:hypothetical protein [Bacillus sp. WP8]|uniref:hypothetical protein n=1 Tax=Bacillus sp. WP8 TaxID=756828 RepID=UPI001642C51E|nr:hypothetical protein [Bacillus sp. WP8]
MALKKRELVLYVDEKWGKVLEQVDKDIVIVVSKGDIVVVLMWWGDFGVVG